jgi:hypothetical protein
VKNIIPKYKFIFQLSNIDTSVFILDKKLLIIRLNILKYEKQSLTTKIYYTKDILGKSIYKMKILTTLLILLTSNKLLGLNIFLV